MKARLLAVARSLVVGLAADVVAPVLAYAAVARAMWPEVWEERASASPLGLFHGSVDHQGTLWFYWWLHKWAFDGESLLLCHYVCAPDAQFLRTNFPNRIDAWAAQPFLAALPTPTAMSLFVLAIPVLGAMAAFALIRQATTDRVAAWLGGLPFGFQLYVSYEVGAGRPVTALLAPGVAFLAAFALALRAPGRGLPVVATAVAGIGAAVAAQAYLPHAPYLGLLAVGLALARVAWPAEGAARWRPVLVGVGALVLAVWLSGPYLYEVSVQRRFAPHDVHDPTAASYANPVGDQRFWPALVDRMRRDVRGGGDVQGGPIAGSMGFDPWVELGPAYRSVQAESLGWRWPWESSLDRGERLVDLGPVWLVGGVLLALFGRARGVAALLVAGGMYVLSLGPAVMESVQPHVVTYAFGGGLPRLPTAWLLDEVPAARMFLRPYRVAPFVHLFLGVGMALGLARLAEGRGGWPRRIAVAVGGGVLAFAALEQVRGHAAFALPMYDWSPSPFLVQMGEDDADYAIVEVPMGIGQRRAAAQVVHQKRRAGQMQDIQPQDRGGRRPPECYTLALLQGLWELGVTDSTRHAEAVGRLGPEAREEARAAGFRYVVVWLDDLRDSIRQGDPRTYVGVMRELDAALGPRHYEDAQLVVYAI